MACYLTVNLAVYFLAVITIGKPEGMASFIPVCGAKLWLYTSLSEWQAWDQCVVPGCDY